MSCGTCACRIVVVKSPALIAKASSRFIIRFSINRRRQITKRRLNQCYRAGTQSPGTIGRIDGEDCAEAKQGNKAPSGHAPPLLRLQNLDEGFLRDVDLADALHPLLTFLLLLE